MQQPHRGRRVERAVAERQPAAVPSTTVPGTRSAAIRAMPYAASTPTTRSPGSAARRRVTRPVPQATSSSVPVPGGSSDSTASAAATARGSPPRDASYRTASLP
ncbi:hypothetical protein SMD44_07090 [Streptomyces alboflavus]|uniref:Uncharacterized protein n=1 Tax=Streptomyces alboflavus TaxID=67267 RepID=A0A1Z1WMK2_9ACTN|nr:hypothetical protein SMD44_07090 [Streptomyces alboflavus]